MAATLSVVLLAGCGARQVKPEIVKEAVLTKVKPEAMAEFEGGMRLLRLGPREHDRAAERLRRAAELDGSFFEAAHNLGCLLLAEGKVDEAVSELRHALDVQPASRPTLFALGEAYSRAGSFDAAEKLFAGRAAAEPDDAELRLRYIQILRDGGKADEALKEARALLARDGKNAAAYNALGLVYYRTGKPDLAETALRRATELDGKNARFWNNMGLVALARGRDQEAFAHFQKASEMDPKYAEARLNKAVVFLDCGDYKRAQEELERARDSTPADPDVLVALGVALRGQNKLDEARRAYERALDLSPRHAGALYNLGILYMDFQHDKGKAKEYFGKYVDAAPKGDPKRADADGRLKELK